MAGVRRGGSGGSTPGGPGRGRGKRTAGGRPRRDSNIPKAEWIPKTRLGKLVKDGKMTSMSEVLASGHPLREPEIVDILLPDLADEVIDVNMVQRMTDSGRRVRFSITAAVGNKDGFVGLGQAKGKEVGPMIRKAIDNAKLNIIEIKRGCGSWECGCGTAHTLPFEVIGKSASTVVSFRPAPRGIGLAVGKVAKQILTLAGVKDAWGFTRGQTRTTVNYATAAYEALRKTSETRVLPAQRQKLSIASGAVGGIKTDKEVQ
ncbi:MAG: 30S ribosomal protein S5 [Thermoplasmata archaeon HGW-Thermoplasmata-1]|nr:MAG: 30S ribosomal protein S5 [Thermoplasmata archaeon HGW-Thermoplasmata-1]